MLDFGFGPEPECIPVPVLLRQKAAAVPAVPAFPVLASVLVLQH